MGLRLFWESRRVVDGVSASLKCELHGRTLKSVFVHLAHPAPNEKKRI